MSNVANIWQVKFSLSLLTFPGEELSVWCAEFSESDLHLSVLSQKLQNIVVCS